MAMTSQAASRQTSSSVPPAKPPTSLIDTAIFTPFTGIPLTFTGPPNTREEKLKTILSNLDKQHASVRQNMLQLVLSRKAQILKDAETKLRADAKSTTGATVRYAPGNPVSEEEQARWAKWERENSRYVGDTRDDDEMVRRMGSTVSTDTRLNATSIKKAIRSTTAVEDTQMGDMSIRPSTKPARKYNTSADAIRASTSRQLDDLLTSSIYELEAYDLRANGTRAEYERALQREIARVKALVEANGSGGSVSDPIGAIIAGGDVSGVEREKGSRLKESGRRFSERQEDDKRFHGRSTVDASRDPRRR